MSRLKGFYIDNQNYKDVRADNSIDPYATLPVCKTCGQRITIKTQQEQDDRGIAIDFEIERGHLPECADRHSEKLIGGEK